tara:strand:+ start:139 stop:642 length:504 start_codon:yes stop_codon:yes gene_type:complete
MANTTSRYGKTKAPYAERKNTYGYEGNKSTVITPKGGGEAQLSRVEGMNKKAATKQAKNDAEGVGLDYEGMKTAYDKYKLSDDPSSEKLRKQLAKGSVKAEKPLSKALRASDDAYLAGSEEIESKLKKAAAPKLGEYNFKKGGMVKSSASSRGDGCAQRGKTKGRMI